MYGWTDRQINGVRKQHLACRKNITWNIAKIVLNQNCFFLILKSFGFTKLPGNDLKTFFPGIKLFVIVGANVILWEVDF